MLLENNFGNYLLLFVQIWQYDKMQRRISNSASCHLDFENCRLWSRFQVCALCSKFVSAFWNFL